LKVGDLVFLKAVSHHGGTVIVPSTPDENGYGIIINCQPMGYNNKYESYEVYWPRTKETKWCSEPFLGIVNEKR